MTARRRIVVVGLGNELLGDDGVGLLAVRRLALGLPDGVEVHEWAGSGLDLLDVLEGADAALILDTVVTGRHPPGTRLEFAAEELPDVAAASPHAMGLPDLRRTAAALGLPIPGTIRILACEVADPYRLREGLSEAVACALPLLVARARTLLAAWAALPRPESHP